MYNALQDNYIHWSADIKAGESLGECVAAEALKAAAG
jgi:hypothetical protein